MADVLIVLILVAGIVALFALLTVVCLVRIFADGGGFRGVEVDAQADELVVDAERELVEEEP